MSDTFRCPGCGEQEQVSQGGYSLGHRTGLSGPNELDLEGIRFVFDVESTEPLELSLARHDATSGYLDKFADWEEKVTSAAENDPEQECPECTGLMFWPGDDREL